MCDDLDNAKNAKNDLVVLKKLAQLSHPFEQAEKTENIWAAMMKQDQSSDTSGEILLQISKLKSENPIVQWMIKRISTHGGLRQEFAVLGIQHHFGEENVYTNANRNLAIEKKILTEFLEITLPYICWDKRNRAWRPKGKLDLVDKRECIEQATLSNDPLTAQ